MKLYSVTTSEIDLNTLENETVTTIRTEAEMGVIFDKPKKLYKSVVQYSYTRDYEHKFYNCVVTRIQ